MRAQTTKQFLTVLAVLAIAALTVHAGTKANPRKGKAMFKKQCRVCHDGKTEGAPALQPADRIADQWERAFKKEKDVAECLPRVKERSGAELTKQDLDDIKSYLVDFAADSEQPATCG